MVAAVCNSNNFFGELNCYHKSLIGRLTQFIRRTNIVELMMNSQKSNVLETPLLKSRIPDVKLNCRRVCLLPICALLENTTVIKNLLLNVLPLT